MSETARAVTIAAPCQVKAQEYNRPALRPGRPFIEMGELSLNLLVIVCKGLHLIGLSNHLSTGHRPSMALTARYQDQMPLNMLVTYRFLLEQALDRALESACMKAIFAPL